MELSFSHSEAIVSHTLGQMIDACSLIIIWNENVDSYNDYLVSPAGIQKMAASCMLIESIGEGVKKSTVTCPDFLKTKNRKLLGEA